MPTSIGVTRLASGTVTGYLVGRKADMQITNTEYTYDDDGNVTGITETSEQPRDGDPDTFEMGGAVTFSPTVRHLTWTPEGGKPQMIHLVDVVCSFDARGTLVGPDGEENVVLTATDAPGITPTGWGWKVSFGDSRDADGALVAGADPDRDSFVFSLPAGSTVDLAVAEAAAGAAANPKYVVVDATTAQRAEAAAERAEAAAASVDLTGYLKSADAEATYAPKSHKHAMADVTGLQAALDAKASTGTATTSAAGLMSAADKKKLDGIAEGGGGGGIPDGSVTTDKLAAWAVTTNKLDSKAVTTTKLADGAVAYGKIDPNAVTSIRSFLLVAANAQTDQALTALGFNHDMFTPKEMAVNGRYVDGTLRLCWISGTTLEVAPISFFGNLQTEAVTLYAKGSKSTASGVLGVDESWTITALPTDVDGVSF